MRRNRIRLTESQLKHLIRESIGLIISEDKDSEMESDWNDLERKEKYYNSAYPASYVSRYPEEGVALGWAGAGKTPGALAMDAQLPYEHPYTSKTPCMYKKADTSKWREPSMKERGYEGQNAARNYARSFRFTPEDPYRINPVYDPGRLFRDNDMNNLDDPKYFDKKIYATDGRWYPSKKEYYKNLRNASQIMNGDADKKKAKRNADRMMKAADERPLWRKGALNGALDETISRAIRKVLR